MTAPRIRLGTRASPLALAQAHMVADALATAHGWDRGEIALVPLTTTGDRVQDRALAEIGGKALWTKELDAALLGGHIDAAVHSMKDVETIRPPEIRIAAMLPRADVRDRLIGAASIETLPLGARVGTASPRRAAQLLALRPDLKIGLFRGNVATRLRKLAEGEADATLLAAAGLHRLGQDDVGSPVPVEVMLPAPAQGAIGIEVRAADSDATRLLAAISHAPTFDAVMMERALLAALGGTCRSPVAALALPQDSGFQMRAEILLPDGGETVRGEASGCSAEDAAAQAMALGRDLLSRASPALRALFEG
ncbi:hydroxymethylbilane synthase [Tardibacter chloracetimidivorans]|uniref:Porphobilinogen deaminase n=1 Tax=Tardibacter chloracetimidivorans TaxID=1921510 RepID=A0A1L3ZWI1_9SPHN|nr:hydroxymethylbilane synthase [Tardibacter chloracetimidivorans]API59970.1 hydroxymethylbilane synthase [Tardibacter chloracetimidivorans]